MRSPSPEFNPISQKRKDLFGNEDLFGSDLPDTGATSVIRKSSDTNIEKSSPDDDIFSSKSIGFPKSKTKVDDMDDLFSGAKSDSKIKNADDGLGDDGDLFSSSKQSTKTPHVKDEPVKQAPVETKPSKPVLVDDDDDIFAIKKSKPKPKPSPIIEDDDDDLFASSSLKKPKSKDSGPKETNGLPDDDIFANSNVGKKKGRKILFWIKFFKPNDLY